MRRRVPAGTRLQRAKKGFQTCAPSRLELEITEWKSVSSQRASSPASNRLLPSLADRRSSEPSRRRAHRGRSDPVAARSAMSAPRNPARPSTASASSSRRLAASAPPRVGAPACVATSSSASRTLLSRAVWPESITMSIEAGQSERQRTVHLQPALADPPAELATT